MRTERSIKMHLQTWPWAGITRICDGVISSGSTSGKGSSPKYPECPGKHPALYSAGSGEEGSYIGGKAAVAWC